MPLSPMDRIRLDRAAVDGGFGIPRGNDGDWLAYDSLAGPSSIRLTCAGQTSLVAVNHLGAAQDLALRWQEWPESMAPQAPPGFVAFAVTDTAALHQFVADIWRLAQALPEQPLRTFEAQSRTLPQTTEAERLIIQRVGQDIFRDALLTYWQGRCPLTGIAHPRLLRASHMKPWAHCDTDAERLDVHNGLLLAAHLDAAFDAGLISFADDGTLLYSPQLNADDASHLGLPQLPRLDGIKPPHLPFLDFHRSRVFARGLTEPA